MQQRNRLQTRVDVNVETRLGGYSDLCSTLLYADATKSYSSSPEPSVSKCEWSPAGKGADLLALVCGVFCEFVTFPLVSWVRCGT